jgi:hypothetical protein
MRPEFPPIVTGIDRTTSSRQGPGAEGVSPRDLHRGPHGGADGMRNLADMLALDVRPLANQDRDVGRCEVGWRE